MSKAAELAALIGSQSAQGNRNLIINGAMQVAQRGTSETSVTTAGYRNACDRYRVGGNNGTWTISQDTDAPAGFSNSFKMLLTATETISSTSYWSVEQRIEGQNLQGLAYGTSSAKTITVSFYVKSNVTGTYCLNLYQDDGSKNFPKTYTIDSANTWERKTISFVGDTATALDNDNAKSLRTIFFQVSGSASNSGTPGSRAAYADNTFAAGHTAQIDAVNDYWQITGLQLEVGEQATPFEHRSFGDELRRCQRYYFRTTGSSTGYGNLATVSRIGNTLYRGVVEFPVTMRSRPSFSSSGSFQTLDSGFTLSSISGGDGASFDSHGVQVTMTSNGSAGQSSLLRQAADGQAALIYDAEL